MAEIGIVIDKSCAPAVAIGIVRKHADISIADVRARMENYEPAMIFTFSGIDMLDQIKKCRDALRELKHREISFTIAERLSEAEPWETRPTQYIINIMRRHLGIAKDIRDEMFAEAEELEN